jgi:hypothetical protein
MWMPGPARHDQVQRFTDHEEAPMPKGEQRSNKMAKKPKKDNSAPKEHTSDRPVPPTTTVMPKGKLKKAP